MIGVNGRKVMGGVSEQYDENSYVQDGLIFQLDGIAKGNSDDTSTWVDLKGGLVFTQDGVVTSTDKGWYPLPTIASGTTTLQTVTFYISAGSSPAVTFTFTHNIYYSDGFEIAADSTYEVSALWNVVAWIVASVTIIVE